MDFRPGLTIITGETGSGKSILLDALGLLLGDRADSTALRDKQKKCILEARFEISRYNLDAFFKENDLDYDGTCILRRELSPQGKSRSFINDTPVNLVQLRELGNRLVDVHSQHDTLQLSDSGFLTSLLDGAAGNKTLLLKYREVYNFWIDIGRRLENLKEQQAKMAQEEDFLNFQFKELEELNPVEGEERRLESEMDVLKHADKIREQTSQAGAAIDDSETGAIKQVYRAMQSLAAISGLSREAQDLHERIKSVHIELKDIHAAIEDFASSAEGDPGMLSELEQRWDKLNHVMQKHRVDSARDLILLMQQISDKLTSQEDASEELGKLEEQHREKGEELVAMATELHRRRAKVLPGLEKDCLSLLKQLGIPKASVAFKLDKTEHPDKNGMSRVQMMFSANAGQELRELSKVASGGEFSRLMLSLKKILAETAELPTIIFDEIDTGVSGAIADMMGEVLSSMSKRMQVLVITHLPQIAGKGDDHLKVMKLEARSGTISRLSRLDSPDRVDEIAAMLSGTELTDAARTHAKTLLGL